MTDWFQRLTGFAEDDYASTQQRLAVDGEELVSHVNGNRYGIGQFSLPTVAELRARVNPARGQRSSFEAVIGEARSMHSDPRFAGALFQAASQFNVLEMVSQHVTPEEGVTRYAWDGTQGPACAIAAGAATIYRNYLVPVGDGVGQTADRQIDALAGVGSELAQLTGRRVDELWTMSNGYALCTADGLTAISELLEGATEEMRHSLGGQLSIGLHRNVEVTDVAGPPRRLVSQAFCSALPLGYSGLARSQWEPFARLILEATYEATLLAAAEQADAGGSNLVLLTRVGGGVFDNDPAWIDAAIERAARIVEDAGLDIRVVCHRVVSPGVRRIAERWG